MSKRKLVNWNNVWGIKHIVKRLNHWRKYRRIVKKVQEKLPKYAPQSGIKLTWDVKPGYWINDGWDRETGEMINPRFFPVPQLRQLPPREWQSDPRIYQFDYPTKSLTYHAKERWAGYD